MAGTNYIGNAYQQLSQMLSTPIAGRDSAGFDALSGQYGSTVDSGMADISRRGIGQSGAVPELFQKAGEQYATGAGQVVASGQLQENQRMQQILQAMLGLGNAQAGQSRADMSQRLETTGAIESGLVGLFGDTPTAQSLFNPNAPNQPGLISKGLYGSPKSLFSQMATWLGIP